MKKTSLGVLTSLLAITAMAQAVNFDGDAVGSVPSGWTCGVTGRGSPRWAIATDPTAPSKPNVLMQSGSGTFPWCVKSGTSLADGFVEVKFKPISGGEDQAGGLVWRWKDGENHYVARANALENNVSLYYTERGSRKTIKYVDAPVARGSWHTLRVDFAGARIAVSLDGKRYIELDDSHIGGAGAVGVWTKADSVTAFDDFAYGAARP
ncbi:MAG TPA: hypothetical protein VGJ35_06570 [Burkholderiaceae bacterium]